MSKKHRKNEEQAKPKVKEWALPCTMVQHPAAKRPWLAAAIGLFLIFMMWTMIAGWKDNIIIPLLLMALIIHSLIPFYFKTTVIFDDEGVSVKRFGKPEVFKWDDYRSFSMQDNGVVMWMDMRPAVGKGSFSEYFKSLRRSVFLPIDAELLGKAEEILKRKLVRVTS